MPDPGSIEAFLTSITLYADEDLVVLDKPAGLAVQKGTRTDEHIDGMLISQAARTGERWRLVHRLDKDTAGCLLLARTREAAAYFGRQFERKTITKTYWAVVSGVPEPRHGTIDLPLIKARTPLGDRVRPAEAGEIEDADAAATRYEVLAARAGKMAWLRLEPLTGRQHQIRAHLAAIGHPIVGDRLYNRAYPSDGSTGQKLHLLARGLAFRHPRGEHMSILAPAPPHMTETLARAGLRREDIDET